MSTPQIESVLSRRTPRTLDDFEREELEAHKFACLQCARAALAPTKYSPCDAVLVWSTTAKAYTYEIDKCAADCNWCKTSKEHTRKVAEQHARNPEEHRRFWEGVAWSFRPNNTGAYAQMNDYVRMQWCCSTLQIVRGNDTGVEELLYNCYAQIE